MAEEFNIFKNLDELRKTNLLDQLKSLETYKADDLNDNQGLGNDDFDFYSLVDNNIKKPPTKEHPRKKDAVTPKKKSSKSGKPRQSSVSFDGSLSPCMSLINTVAESLYEMPIARRTRRSFGACNKNTEAECVEVIQPSTSNNSRKTKGRRRGGGGGGRGRGSKYVASISSYDLQNNTIEISEESICNGESSDHDSSDMTTRSSQRGNVSRSRVMRARRRYFAEVAARSTQVDYVDLVSSPMPRVEGFIDLDSDTEEPTRVTRSKNKDQRKTINNSNKAESTGTKTILDMSFDEDNPELSIKVKWKGKLEAFKLRKYQKFSVIFNQLAKRENISAESILFNLDDRIIMADDTPDSINYKIFQFIDGRVLSNCFNSLQVLAGTNKKNEANKIILKIQSDKWKRPLQIDIMKTDKFRVLYIKCAEEVKAGIDQLRLSFDGELIKLNDTPTDLDLEGGEVIDLCIKN